MGVYLLPVLPECNPHIPTFTARGFVGESVLIPSRVFCSWLILIRCGTFSKTPQRLSCHHKFLLHIYVRSGELSVFGNGNAQRFSA